MVEKSDYETQRDMAHFNAAMTIGQQALKAGIIINGGAAIAMLAFIGQMVQSGHSVGNLCLSLTAFSVGIVAASIAAIRLFKSQISFSHANYDLEACPHRLDGEQRQRRAINAGVWSIMWFLAGTAIAGFAMTALA